METEVKISLADRTEAERVLLKRGFRVSAPRQFEANDIYDTEDHSLRRNNMLLRLRKTGEKAVVTWKGPAVPGPHKSRPELETGLQSAEVLGSILEQLGYRRVFRYEKYRSEFGTGQEHSVVTLDETPIGDFMEIEGEPEWIDATAGELGFSRNDYILDSYGKLYVDYCKKHGLEPRDMVFASN